MALKPVEWFKVDAQVLDDLPNPWPSEASLKLSPAAPHVVFNMSGGEDCGAYTAAPIPVCPACGSNDAGAVISNRTARISDTEHRFILAIFECHACGLELHALPH